MFRLFLTTKFQSVLYKSTALLNVLICVSALISLMIPDDSQLKKQLNT